MWVPKHFELSEHEAFDAIEAYSFATLVTAVDGAIEATHIPILLNRGSRMLIGHVARANPHWRAFDGEREALAIFQGPHAYISPSWYPPGFAVPTWDYVAVHVYGRTRIISDEARVLRLLRATVEAYEETRDEPWRLSDQPVERVTAMGKGVVAFAMPIDRIDAKAKMGQNRPEAQGGVATALEASSDSTQQAVGRLVRRVNSIE